MRKQHLINRDKAVKVGEVIRQNRLAMGLTTLAYCEKFGVDPMWQSWVEGGLFRLDDTHSSVKYGFWYRLYVKLFWWHWAKRHMAFPHKPIQRSEDSGTDN